MFLTNDGKIKSETEMKTFIATYILDKEGDLSKTDKPMVEKIQDKIEYVFDKANDYERIKEKLIRRDIWVSARV